jgi:hypothetical protein
VTLPRDHFCRPARTFGDFRMIVESYGNKATADLKRLLESLIEKAN